METIDYQEFETRLKTMAGQLRANIEKLEEELAAIVAEDEIDDMEDLAALESDSTRHNLLLAQQRRELAEVEHALDKIARGTYGSCEKSGHPIPIERLRAEPHTRYCIEHARAMGS